MKKIKNGAELNDAVNSNDLVVCKIGAPWCGPCRAIEASIKEIEAENMDLAEFVEVDVDEADEDFVASLGIRNIPVLLFYKDGKPVDSFKTIGLITKAALIDKITELKQ